MYVRSLRRRSLIVFTLICLTFTSIANAADETTLTKKQIKQFLDGEDYWKQAIRKRFNSLRPDFVRRKHRKAKTKCCTEH